MLTNQTVILLAFLALFLVWLFAPLVPAMLTYVLAPKEKVIVSGPLQGLTIKATGAFAAYLTVFLVCVPFVYMTWRSIRNMSKPYWDVEIPISTFDTNAKPVDLGDELNSIRININPPTYSISGNIVTVRVNAIDERLPKIGIDIPKFGGTLVDLEHQQPSPDVREDQRLIRLSLVPIQQRKPLVIGEAK